jgi:hypothetical protein
MAGSRVDVEPSSAVAEDPVVALGGQLAGKDTLHRTRRIAPRRLDCQAFNSISTP